MRYLFILNPAAGKQDCTVQLIPQLQQAAVRAGIPVDAVATCKTEYAGHAKALARAAAEEAAKAGEQLHIWTAGGDGTLVEALTGVQGFANAAVGCLPYGSGNDFLRTYGTQGGVYRPRRPAGGRGSDHRHDADQSGPFRHHLRGGAGRPGGLWHPEVPAYPPVRRRDGLRSLHCGAALWADRPQDRV